MITNAKKTIVLNLLDQGRSVSYVSAKLGIPVDTVLQCSEQRTEIRRKNTDKLAAYLTTKLSAKLSST